MFFFWSWHFQLKTKLILGFLAKLSISPKKWNLFSLQIIITHFQNDFLLYLSLLLHGTCIYWISVFDKFQGLKLNLISIGNPNILIDCILHFQHDNFKLFFKPIWFSFITKYFKKKFLAWREKNDQTNECQTRASFIIWATLFAWYEGLDFDIYLPCLFTLYLPTQWLILVFATNPFQKYINLKLLHSLLNFLINYLP